MADFPLRNILVPAVLVSSTVFSVLTLPVLNVRPTSVALNLPSFLGGNLHYSIFERGNKNLTIRYIGFVIVASAGSGIATAELVRKWHSRLEKKQANLQLLAQQMNSSTAIASEVESELGTSLSSDDLEEDLALDRLTLDELSTTPATALTFSDEDGIDYFARSIAIAVDSEAVPKLTDLQDFNLITPEGLNGKQQEHAVLTAPAPPERIFELLNHCQPCHIQLPHTERCFFAITVEGMFYSLLKLALTEEDALAIAHYARAKTDRKVVITKTDQGYAVWLWEADARLHVE